MTFLSVIRALIFPTAVLICEVYMFNIIRARLQQKHRTMPFPSERTTPVDRFRGYPHIDISKCSENCSMCISSCPVDALQKKENEIRIDLGKCLFCGDCSSVCSTECITFTNDYQLAARNKNDLIIGDKERVLKAELNKQMKALFGRSLKLRQVSAGGCNACEADTNVLNTVGFDLGRFGIQFVASPRHADGILVTGPVSKNMKLALEKTYKAVPTPKIVIATGACAISGGIFRGHEEVCDGVDAVLPVDLYIPGCPPHPLTILDGLLRMLGRISDNKR